MKRRGKEGKRYRLLTTSRENKGKWQELFESNSSCTIPEAPTTTLGPKGRRPLSEAMHSEHDLKERQRRTNHSESFPLWGHNPSTQPAASAAPLF